MLCPDDLEVRAEAGFESHRTQPRVQFLAAAGDTRKHRILGCHEFDQQQIRGQFGCQGGYLGERNPFGNQHVMDHREHQDGIEGGAGTLEKGRELGVAPSDGWSWPRKIYDEWKDIQVLLPGVAPRLADYHRVGIDGYYAGAASRGQGTEESGVTSHI
jgi:hypothetical protein